MQATRAIKRLPAKEQPHFFEVITGASIRSYLLQDFPSVFTEQDEAVLILAVEANSSLECEEFYARVEQVAIESLTSERFNRDDFYKKQTTKTLRISEGIDEFEIMRKPRGASEKITHQVQDRYGDSHGVPRRGLKNRLAHPAARISE